MVYIYNFCNYEKCNEDIREILSINNNINLVVTDASNLYVKFRVKVEVCPLLELMFNDYDDNSTLIVLSCLRNIKMYERYLKQYEKKE